MCKFRVTFIDEIEAKNENEAYDLLLKYLQECCDNGDVTAFGFEEKK